MAEALALPVVLVVDDSATVRSIVKVHLTGSSVEVWEADSAATALAMLDREAVSLLILDWHMPGVDGIELLRRIRADNRPNVRDLPVIMLTGDAKLDDESPPGVQAVVHKPVSKSGLQDAVSKLLRTPVMQRR